MILPELSGSISTDPAVVDRFTVDGSRYAVRPSAVAVPRDEEDLRRLVEFSADRRVPLTCRGAGSNLSGSAVGAGVIVHFADMASLQGFGDDSARTQPGLRYEQLNDRAAARGLCLRYDVSSGRNASPIDSLVVNFSRKLSRRGGGPSRAGRGWRTGVP